MEEHERRPAAALEHATAGAARGLDRAPLHRRAFREDHDDHRRGFYPGAPGPCSAIDTPGAFPHYGRALWSGTQTSSSSERESSAARRPISSPGGACAWSSWSAATVHGEQSRKNWGFVRQQGRDPSELPLMMESNRFWRGLEAELGADIEWVQGGNLALAADDERMALFERVAARRARLRASTAASSRRPILPTSFPGSPGAWAGGLYTPSDGHADPEKATDALARAAVAHGREHPPRVRGGGRRHSRRRGRARSSTERGEIAHLLGGLRGGGVVVAARADPRPRAAAALGPRHGGAHDAGAARHARAPSGRRAWPSASGATAASTSPRAAPSTTTSRSIPCARSASSCRTSGRTRRCSASTWGARSGAACARPCRDRRRGASR